MVFDIGGVLLRSTSVSSTSQRWERRLGLTDGWILNYLQAEFLPQADSGIWTEEEVWQHFARGIGAPQHVEEIARDAWWWDEVDEELLAFAANIRSAVRLGIISNAWPGARANACDRFGLSHIFHEIVISSEERCTKPSREIYEIALKRLQVLPSQTVFVDDFAPNVEAAAELGFHGILHTSASRTIRTLEGMFSR